MIKNLPRPLLFWLAVWFFASLGCGTTNSGASLDGGDGATGQECGADDGASRCKGPPPSCVLGEAFGTDVVMCGDIFSQGRCFEGAEGAYYYCPEGSVVRSSCTCGAPGLPFCSN